MVGGLMGHFKAPKVEVVHYGDNKGRGVVAMEAIARGGLHLRI